MTMLVLMVNILLICVGGDMKVIYGAFALLSLVLGAYLWSGIETNIFCGKTFVDDHEALKECRQSAKAQMDEAVKIALAGLTTAMGLHARPKELEPDSPPTNYYQGDYVAEVPQVRPMPPPNYDSESTTG